MSRPSDKFKGKVNVILPSLTSKRTKQQSQETILDMQLGKKKIKTHEDLVKYVERRINNYNNIKGAQFRKEGYSEHFEAMTNKLALSTGLNQTKTGLEKGLSKLRQYSPKQLLEIVNNISEVGSAKQGGTVKQYEKKLRELKVKTLVDIETKFNQEGQLDLFESMTEKEKTALLHKFIMKLHYHQSRSQDYDSEQVLRDILETEYGVNLDEYTDRAFTDIKNDYYRLKKHKANSGNGVNIVESQLPTNIG